MRSPTQFDGTAKAHHPDFFAVFFAKQSNGSHFAGFLHRGMAMFVQLNAGTNLTVDQTLHPADFVFAHFLKMRKIETQQFVRNIRTFLLYVSTQHFSQGFVQKMSRRMISRNTVTPFPVDHCTENPGRIGGKLGTNMHA